MLDKDTIRSIANELAAAEANRSMVPLLTARYSAMEVEDSYAVQAEWVRRGQEAGRRLVGHKIGLTSKVMQEATGITEPDYGAIFADMVYENGAHIECNKFSNVRIEVELAFVLDKDLSGPDTTIFDVLEATKYVVPALEILSLTRSPTTPRWARWSTGATRWPRMLLICAGAPRCCIATKRSKIPVLPLPY